MTTETTPEAAPKQAWLPPRWFIRTAWVVHRWIYNTTDGRRGLQVPTEKHWGLMRLRTIGRKSGDERIAILAYVDDGPNLVTLAMNGWGAPEPAWWLNLQAKPDAVVELNGGETRPIQARKATPEERPRLWGRFSGYFGDSYDSWAARRPRETAVVILEPRH
jgi:deazaflavin-dependent oxidoreductase (nitroreductase family)